MIIKKSDLTEMRYCSRGVREFFKRHNLDYSDFLKNGIESEELLKASNNDAMAMKAVEYVDGRRWR